MEMVCNKLIVDSCLISSLIFLLLLFNAAVASTAVGDDNRPVEGGGNGGRDWEKSVSDGSWREAGKLQEHREAEKLGGGSNGGDDETFLRIT